MQAYFNQKKIPFLVISSAKEKIFLTILKNKNEYLGKFYHFNSSLNVYFNPVIKFLNKKKKKYLRIFKEIIINGSKICFLSFF